MQYRAMGGWAISRSCAGLAVAALLLLAAAGTAHPADLPKADRILVLKSRHLLELLRDGVVVKSYPIALGSRPLGHKQWRGDHRTPEGVYIIDRRTARTRFHRALHISYPDELDVLRARALHRNPGGGIYIHGMPARFGRTDPVRFFKDWTDGCIAVGNIAIEEIWNAVDDGTSIDIRP